MTARYLVTITALTVLLASCSPPADSIVQLRVLETSDIHMHVVDYDYFQDQPSVTVGLARTAALLAAARVTEFFNYQGLTYVEHNPSIWSYV